MHHSGSLLDRHVVIEDEVQNLLLARRQRAEGGEEHRAVVSARNGHVGAVSVVGRRRDRTLVGLLATSPRRAPPLFLERCPPDHAEHPRQQLRPSVEPRLSR